jgi:hypothetical protein
MGCIYRIMTRKIQVMMARKYHFAIMESIPKIMTKEIQAMMARRRQRFIMKFIYKTTTQIIPTTAIMQTLTGIHIVMFHTTTHDHDDHDNDSEEDGNYENVLLVHQSTHQRSKISVTSAVVAG